MKKKQIKRSLWSAGKGCLTHPSILLQMVHEPIQSNSSGKRTDNPKLHTPPSPTKPRQGLAFHNRQKKAKKKRFIKYTLGRG